MNDDERFDTWVQSAAREYNRPPERVPHDEMWSVIEQSLASTPAAARGSRARWSSSWPVYAMAATLLLAVGVGSGYWLAGRSQPGPSAQTAATKPAAAPTTGTFDVALQTHMANAEAFLVAYRGTAQSDSDAHVREWARDVLGTTRLMMDAPSAADPARRRLLEDLEFILVQIVQLPDSAPADERALIDRSLKREQLLTRLRTSIPAGIVRGS